MKTFRQTQFKPSIRLIVSWILILIGGRTALGLDSKIEAEPIHGLVRILEAEVLSLVKEMNSLTEARELQQENGHDEAIQTEAWFYKDLFLSVRAKASFSIPAFATVQIIPEIIMLWQRPVPDGWVIYNLAEEVEPKIEPR